MLQRSVSAANEPSESPEFPRILQNPKFSVCVGWTIQFIRSSTEPDKFGPHNSVLSHAPVTGRIGT
jgi:hypothetical protein